MHGSGGHIEALHDLGDRLICRCSSKRYFPHDAVKRFCEIQKEGTKGHITVSDEEPVAQGFRVSLHLLRLQERCIQRCTMLSYCTMKNFADDTRNEQGSV